MSAARLETIEIETAPSPVASVIWLHGLGADGNDFAPIVPEIDLGGIAVRYVFPNAPAIPVTVNNGYVMPAWYDISDAAIRREDEAGVRKSQAAIEALIAREKTRGVPAMHIVLAGFSQGGAIALHTGLRHAERIAGIMALSTYVPVADKLAAEASAMNRDVPVFMAHGRDDPVIPLGRAMQSRVLLEQQGYALEWHEYRMPHSVCPEEIRDIATWLKKVLARP
jgi:phospholipase/carboxylesterase